VKYFCKPFICGVSPIYILLFCITAWIFYSNPQLDTGFSALFYSGGKFFGADKRWGMFVYHSVHIAATAVTIFFALHLLFSFIFKKFRFMGISRKTVIYLAMVLILGPGILINSVLKEHIGRARPAETQCFGGELRFTPAFAKTNECDSNCSFVSGHAAFGFYWLTLGFIGGTVFLKRAGYAFGISMGFGVGMVRIMQGRHFLSDIVFAGFFVWLIAAVTYWLFYIKLVKN
jgi:lipid A 4'-phosphatase